MTSVSNDEPLIIPLCEYLDDAFDYLYAKFPSFKFRPAMKPVITQNQLYALCGNRPVVDNELRSSKKYMTLNIYDDEYSTAVILREDFNSAFESICDTPSKSDLICRFTSFLEKHNLNSVISSALLRTEFTDDMISKLIRLEALHIQFTDSYWISYPDFGRFRIALRKGLSELRRQLKSLRFHEILLKDLLRKKSPGPLGAFFYVFDQIGCGTVSCQDTTSGPLIRLVTSNI